MSAAEKPNLNKETPTGTGKETAPVTVESEDVTAESTESAEAEVDESAEADVDEDAAVLDETEGDVVAPMAKSGVDWPRALAFVVLPVLALLLGATAAYLKWEDAKVRDAEVARMESTQVAKDSTIRLLSYQPETVEQELASARDLLTGNFRESYTQLTNDVVIPGAKEKNIAAIANVPAVASVSASPSRAVALVFVNQTVTVGADAPTSTNSSVRVTMEKVGDHWLISEFDPV